MAVLIKDVDLLTKNEQVRLLAVSAQALAKTA